MIKKSSNIKGNAKSASELISVSAKYCSGFCIL